MEAGGGEQMGTDNRQQEIRTDISTGGFLLEKNHRNDEDLVRICQRYTGAICREAQIKE